MRIVTDKRCNVKPGDVYSKLTVIGSPFPVRYGGGRRNSCVCQCECGQFAVIQLGALRSGHTTSCGCHRDAVISAVNRTHGKSKQSNRLYGIWAGIRKRCHYPGDKRWKRYGGRGISICQEWDDFSAFESWALSSGYSDELTIDRENSNGNYEPSNCRWATQVTQQRNRVNNSRLTAFGETKLVVEWAEDSRCLVGLSVVRKRLRDGWNPEDAICQPRMKPYGMRTRVP